MIFAKISSKIQIFFTWNDPTNVVLGKLQRELDRHGNHNTLRGAKQVRKLKFSRKTTKFVPKIAFTMKTTNAINNIYLLVINFVLIGSQRIYGSFGKDRTGGSASRVLNFEILKF